MYARSESDYEEKRTKAIDLLRKTSEKSGTEVAKRTLKSKEREESEVCILAKMVFRESLDAYEDGTMDWDDMVEDLYETLKAVEVPSKE